MSNPLKTYRHNSESFLLIERKVLMIRNILFFGIIALLVVMDFSTAENWRDGTLKSVLPHVIGLTFVFVILVFSFRRGITRQRRAWDSYELLVGPDFVVRRMSGLTEIRVNREEVTAILGHKQGLILRTSSPKLAILIPETLAGFAEVRDVLTQWMPPTKQASAGWRQSHYLLPVILLVELSLFGLFFVSNMSSVEVVTGVPLLLGLVWCLVVIQKSSHFDRKMKRKMWFLLLPVVAIAARLTLAIIHWR